MGQDNRAFLKMMRSVQKVLDRHNPMSINLGPLGRMDEGSASLLRKSKSKEKPTRCEGCGATIVKDKCDYCGRPRYYDPEVKTEAIELEKPAWAKKKATKVIVTGTNNDLEIKYKKGAYVPKITVTGTNCDKVVYTDSILDVTITGVNNDVVVEGLEVIDDQITGVNNDLTVR